jgi:hypothetical protein
LELEDNLDGAPADTDQTNRARFWRRLRFIVGEIKNAAETKDGFLLVVAKVAV